VRWPWYPAVNLAAGFRYGHPSGPTAAPLPSILFRFDATISGFAD
jgi:hypothetical protein